jgi:RNA polymerase sigma-70 factor (ECF subfamily)
MTATNPSRSDFERLMQSSRRRVYNFAYRLMGNAADAEDIIQDAYISAWQHFAGYDASRSFEAWLRRIVINRAIDLVRRRRRVRIFSMDTPAPGEEDGRRLSDDIAAPNSDPAHIVIDSILDERLQRALNALPGCYRAALLLRDVEQRSYEEIAEVMHCALGTVRSRIHRARMLMRKWLQSQYGAEILSLKNM